MEGPAEKRGLFWASISVLSLLLVLFVTASFSGGFSGLSNTQESLAYSVLVMIPLFIVIFLAMRKPAEAKKEHAVLASVAARK